MVISGALFVNQSTFESNSFGGGPGGAGGGAICVVQSNLTIDASSFGNNNAGGFYYGQAFYNGNGGAISATESNVSITTSVFHENSAATLGAAVYVHNSPDKAHLVSPFTIIKASTFESNHGLSFQQRSESAGGAIHIETNSLLSGSNVEIYSSLFHNNLVPQLAVGGAINVAGICKMTIVWCNFTGNGAYTGGAIYYSALGSLIVRGSLFQANHAKVAMSSGETQGGAIAVFGTALVTNCSFIDNHSNGPGGAIFVGNKIGSQVGKFIDVQLGLTLKCMCIGWRCSMGRRQASQCHVCRLHIPGQRQHQGHQ
jgi:hypothetical protein